ncbi:hypothetical protein [Massilia eburnea]
MKCAENILAGLSERAVLYQELAVLNESLERRVAETHRSRTARAG